MLQLNDGSTETAMDVGDANAFREFPHVTLDEARQNVYFSVAPDDNTINVYRAPYRNLKFIEHATVASRGIIHPYVSCYHSCSTYN